MKTTFDVTINIDGNNVEVAMGFGDNTQDKSAQLVEMVSTAVTQMQQGLAKQLKASNMDLSDKLKLKAHGLREEVDRLKDALLLVAQVYDFDDNDNNIFPQKKDVIEIMANSAGELLTAADLLESI